MALYRFVHQYRPNGSLEGVHVIDWTNPDAFEVGQARQPTEEEIAALSETIDAAALLSIDELINQRDALLLQIEALQTEHAEAMQALRDEHAAQMEMMTLAGKIEAIAPEVEALAPLVGGEQAVLLDKYYRSAVFLLSQGQVDLAADAIGKLAELVGGEDAAGILSLAQRVAGLND